MFDFEYIGNIHIHSYYSDGNSTIKTIAANAADAGLDFICLNDHEHMLQEFDLHEEGFYGRTAVFYGLEIGKRFHHFLAYNISNLLRTDTQSPQEIIDQVHAQGGFGFIAHPFEKGMLFREKSIAYTWNDLSVIGYTGICIWNFSSRWKERVKTLTHGLFFLCFKSQLLKGPSKETLAYWDHLCQKRRVVAVGGSDAHGSPFQLGPITLIPLTYEYLLRTINIHIFLRRKMQRGDFFAAKHDVYDAMKEGRLFLAHDNICSAKGFRFSFLADDGTFLMMGEEDTFRQGIIIIVLPDYGEVRLLRNGQVIKTLRCLDTVHRIEEQGVYRVEVYRHLPLFGWRPWIYTNPIYLR